MRFKKLKQAILMAAVLSPGLAMADTRGLTFTDQAWRLPADGRRGHGHGHGHDD